MSKKAEQLILAGTISEMDVFRSVMKRIGKKGGSKNSLAQKEARRRNVKIMLEKRALRKKEG